MEDLNEENFIGVIGDGRGEGKKIVTWAKVSRELSSKNGVN